MKKILIYLGYVAVQAVVILLEAIAQMAPEKNQQNKEQNKPMTSNVGWWGGDSADGWDMDD